jgi:hypothetical protein
MSLTLHIGRRIWLWNRRAARPSWSERFHRLPQRAALSKTLDYDLGRTRRIVVELFEILRIHALPWVRSS